tara:strand:+ start:398 stop:1057 length:660 start_codon:yes stop_codon:yes gene_type:complete
MGEQSDIYRILFTIFDGIETLGIPKADVVRLWSLEMQWFSPEESERVLKALTEAGWILQEGDTLHLTEGVNLEMPSLGWRPMTRRMLSPPRCNLSASEEKPSINSNFSQPRVNSREENHIDTITGESYSHPKVRRETQEKSLESPKSSSLVDRAEGSIPTLIEIISSQSGLDNKEVVRRAQRKRRALGPVTLWMALALVAREQGLDMERVSSAIDKAAE